MSCLLAPSTVIESGMPRASVSRQRLVPLLARSVGLGPVPFPPQRRLCHGPIHCLPLPVEPDLLIVESEPFLPDSAEESGSAPLQEAVVYRTSGSKRARDCLPLDSGAKYVVDCTHGPMIIHPWTSGLLLRAWRWNQRLNLLPEFIREPKRPRNAVARILHVGFLLLEVLLNPLIPHGLRGFTFRIGS